MEPTAFDVAIVGGGPAGAATALSLRAYAPSLAVVVIEASRYATARIGETLPPPARTLLEHLGVWQAFRAQHHRESYGTTAVWGTARPLDNDFIYMPASVGWHLDRAAFDALLASQAEARGATLMLDTRLRDAERTDDEWRLTLSSGSPISARFVVDATGGVAAFARRCGARFVDADRLVGISRLFDGDGGDPRVLVEAFADGWWYTAGLPDGRRITVCMTDADLARRLRLTEAERWHEKLAAMPAVGAMLRESKPCGPVVVHSSESRRLDPVAGDDWLAVGDAASRFDPLSSQGIIKALRSGVFASYAIGDWLTRGDEAGLRRYHRFVLAEFKSYEETRAKYYREEQRWPTSEFWRRRHGLDGQHTKSVPPAVAGGSD
ncbi:MAG TPA: tryptophan 7-halogenase [Blastocatellia bacterium]|nr:tryptophan 7-halogenase [Blastocatellia bacterium]